jgi:hypothetical protein
MIVKMKLRVLEYPEIFNTQGTGKMTKTFVSKGDGVSSNSKGNKCGFAYIEIHAIVQAALLESVNVGLQVLNISNVTEDYEVVG